MLMRHMLGFTMVELMVTLAVTGIVLLFAVPQLATFMASSRIRTSAEVFANAIAQARAEAVRLNTNVEFLTSTGVWQVRQIANNTVLNQGAGKEAMADVTATSSPAGSTRVTFDSFGRIVSPSPVDGTSAIASIDFDVPNGAAFGSTRRPLRVLIQTGGAVKLCDPAVGSTDPRACV